MYASLFPISPVSRPFHYCSVMFCSSALTGVMKYNGSPTSHRFSCGFYFPGHLRDSRRSARFTSEQSFCEAAQVRDESTSPKWYTHNAALLYDVL
ncbi:uncharacterized [Tachysurus ichikawai]